MKQGWYFHRAPDGHVIITIGDGPEPDDPIQYAVSIPPDEWAAVVARMPADGDTAEKRAQVRAFHDGKKATT